LKLLVTESNSMQTLSLQLEGARLTLRSSAKITAPGGREL